MSTLITHEWLAEHGGSENVFEQLGKALPDAEQYSLWNEDKARFPRAHETWLGSTPLRHKKSLALPLLRQAMRSIPVERYDTVLASSHAFGHYNAYRAVKAGRRGFAYVHSPARYIWAPEHDARGTSRAVRLVAPWQQHLDRSTISAEVSYAANSEFVRDRMARSWGITDAQVIHPPVAVDEIAHALTMPLVEADQQLVDQLPGRYILGASRLVDYKRIDSVLELADRIGVPAVIAGDGPSRDQLEAQARSLRVDTQFLGRVSDRLLYELYNRADLFVFLAIEDFGIMPLEAVAAGAPVIVNRRGGAWEGVRQTGAGLPCDPSELDDLLETANKAIGLKDRAGHAAVKKFSNTAFRAKILQWVG